MKLLLDNCVDVRFDRLIVGHEVIHARDLGWQDLSNGKLLSAAEAAGFHALVTTDKNVRHQQNLAGKGIALVTLIPLFTQYDHLVPLVKGLLTALDAGLEPGSKVEIGPT